MKNVTRHTGTLEIVNRLPSSRNGNPRYLCRVDGYTFRTQVDHQHGYAIRNFEREKVIVELGTHYGALTLHTIRKA